MIPLTRRIHPGNVVLVRSITTNYEKHVMTKTIDVTLISEVLDEERYLIRSIYQWDDTETQQRYFFMFMGQHPISDCF